MKRYSLAAFLGVCLIVLSFATDAEWLSTTALLAGFAVLCASFGLILEVWRQQGLRRTAMQVLRTLYFPALRWGIVLTIFHNVFAWLGMTPQSWSFVDTMQAVWSHVFAVAGFDDTLSGTFNIFRALIFGSAIYICTETALRHFHKKAPIRNLKLATTIVLGIVTLIAVLLGLETTGISSGIAASCCIGIGSILALMQPAKTAEASSDDDLQWLRNAIAVLAFAPLTFAVMRALGMQATGGGFIFFWVCGVLAPLFWYSGYHILEEQFEFDLRYGHLLRYNMLEKGARTAWAWTKKASVTTWKGAKKALRATYRGIIAACAAVGRGIKRIGQGFKDILSASNPEDE